MAGRDEFEDKCSDGAAPPGSGAEGAPPALPAGALGGPEPAARGVDEDLLEILEGRRLASIPDVIELMDRIDRALPDRDGLKWFNWLYKRVTEGIGGRRLVAWEDPAWVTELDVVFAELYFDGVARCLSDPPGAPRSWRALLDRRHHPRIAKVQYAVAGINAHINRDLPVALVRAWQARGVARRSRRTPEYRDYDRINAVLAETEAVALAELGTEVLRGADRLLGRADSSAIMRVIRAAREVAWSHGARLARIGLGSPAGRRYVRALDDIAAVYARAMLAPLEGRERARSLPAPSEDPGERHAAAALAEAGQDAHARDRRTRGSDL